MGENQAMALAQLLVPGSNIEIKKELPQSQNIQNMPVQQPPPPPPQRPPPPSAMSYDDHNNNVKFVKKQVQT